MELFRNNKQFFLKIILFLRPNLFCNAIFIYPLMLYFDSDLSFSICNKKIFVVIICRKF